MKYLGISRFALSIGLAIFVVTFAIAQPPGRGPGGRGPGGPGGPGGRGPGGPGPGRGNSNAASTLEAFVAKWLKMDENSDGKLSSDELKDDRLKHLFKASDKNSDGILIQEEMKILFETTSSSSRGGGPGGRRGPPGR